jgi:hypothetical protein
VLSGVEVSANSYGNTLFVNPISPLNFIFSDLNISGSENNLIISENPFFPSHHFNLISCKGNSILFKFCQSFILENSDLNVIQSTEPFSCRVYTAEKNTLRNSYFNNNTISEFVNNTVISDLYDNNLTSVSNCLIGQYGSAFRNNIALGIFNKNFSVATHVYTPTYSKQIMGTTGATGPYLFYIDNVGILQIVPAIS